MLTSVPNPTIDWPTLKDNEGLWHKTLWSESERVLKEMAVKGNPLSELNDIGVYHKVSEAKYVKIMAAEYETERLVPHNWICKGSYPGIWCALFSKSNTYSCTIKPSIIKISFKANYKVFDRKLEEHRKLWEIWQNQKENLSKNNVWINDLNEYQDSMSSRMKDFRCGPNHLEFYKEHAFGAIIAYDDYISLVVIQEEAIENVEFLH